MRPKPADTAAIAATEDRSRAVLEAAGYRVVSTAGSLGPWSLLGLSTADVVLVVVSSRLPSSADYEALRDYPAPPNARKLVHCWREDAPQPHVSVVV